MSQGTNKQPSAKEERPQIASRVSQGTRVMMDALQDRGITVRYVIEYGVRELYRREFGTLPAQVEKKEGVA